MKFRNKERAAFLLDLPEAKNFATRAEWKKRAWDDLIERIEKEKSAKELNRILQSILSPIERDAILNRCIVISRLHDHRTYREISEETWVSEQTISAIKKSFFAEEYRGDWIRGKRTERIREREDEKRLKAARAEERREERFKKIRLGKAGMI